MKDSVVRKLENLVERFEEVQALLGDPQVIGNQDKFRNLSKEFSQLESVVGGFNAYQQAQENLDSANEMLKEDDAEMREMAQEELKIAKAEIERLETEERVAGATGGGFVPRPALPRGVPGGETRGPLLIRRQHRHPYCHVEMMLLL